MANLITRSTDHPSRLVGEDMKEHNRVEMAWLIRKEYWKKAKRIVFQVAVISCLMLLVYAFAAWLIVKYDGSQGYMAVFGNLFLFDSILGGEGTTKVTAGHYLARLVTIIGAFAVPADISLELNRPINVIKISRWLSISSDEDEAPYSSVKASPAFAEARYFIALPSDEYLIDAKVSFFIRTRGERVSGRNQTESLFSHTEHYNRIRGIRSLVMPLNALPDADDTIHSEWRSRTLEDALKVVADESLEGDKRADAFLLITGTLPSGQCINQIQRFYSRQLAWGYKHASDRHVVLTGKHKHPDGYAYIYSNHFEKLYECKNQEESWKNYPAEMFQSSVLGFVQIEPSLFDVVRNGIRHFIYRFRHRGDA